METEKINWANDFGVNELLHETSSQLSGAYGRLCFHNPTDARYTHWQKQGLVWADYEQRIGGMVIDSQLAGEKEITRISEELKTILALEKELLKAQGKLQ
jgi:hypothetical protein